MKKILVTGGAGYIGSFMVRRLLMAGNDVVVLDSLERGHKEVIDKRAIFMQGNLLNKEFLHTVFTSHQFDAVIHFAGYISMGESMKDPGVYFENNTYGSLLLLEAMQKNRIHAIIFSSTAGIYGNPVQVPIPESHTKFPTNPYGESKLMVEHLLSWYRKIYGVNFAALRYFNAAGASLDGKHGEEHAPETHIIPNAIKACITNVPFPLYGVDYDTPDGTCVRDYIHVLDLVEAHMLALDKLLLSGGGYHYNVGTGKGHSNKEVLEMVKKIAARDITILEREKRSGDATTLIADPSSIQEELQFVPKYSDLETIVKTAWQWHKNT